MTNSARQTPALGVQRCMEESAAVRRARITLATLVTTSEHTGSSQYSAVSDVYEGCGVLQMMGIRNICFDVTYTLMISERTSSATLSNVRTGKVLTLQSSNGRPLPQGVYSLAALPYCRLLHFGGCWDTHIAPVEIAAVL